MSETVYNPDLWLESLTRALGAFCVATLDDPDVEVEMSFPTRASGRRRRRLPKRWFISSKTTFRARFWALAVPVWTCSMKPGKPSLTTRLSSIS